jgi:hypothetical protein
VVSLRREDARAWEENGWINNDIIDSFSSLGVIAFIHRQFKSGIIRPVFLAISDLNQRTEEMRRKGEDT